LRRATKLTNNGAEQRYLPGTSRSEAHRSQHRKTLCLHTILGTARATIVGQALTLDSRHGKERSREAFLLLHSGQQSPATPASLADGLDEAQACIRGEKLLVPLAMIHECVPIVRSDAVVIGRQWFQRIPDIRDGRQAFGSVGQCGQARQHTETVRLHHRSSQPQFLWARTEAQLAHAVTQSGSSAA
jgi:hypothetical protein